MRITIGLGAVLVASAALGAFGLRSLSVESERARSKHLADALEAVAVVAASFEERLDELARGELTESVALQLTEEGLLSPLLGPPRADELRSPVDSSLHDFIAAEVDRFEREGRIEAAREQLRSAAERDDEWLFAWAMTALAALARREGDIDAERAALEPIAQLSIGVRDARGLSRALAVRHALAELDRAPFDARLAIFAALVADHRSQRETATAELATRVRAGLEPPDAAGEARLAEVLAEDARRARLRALEQAGVGGFLFGARPGERRALSAPADPLRYGAQPIDWVAAAARDGGGAALELEALAESALSDPEVVAFAREGLALSIVLGGAAPVAGAVGEDPPLATRAVPLAGAPGLEVRAAARDLQALLASERRRFAITAGLAGVALLVALFAAIATARAVSREARAGRERETFVAAVSHELRTPLASARLLADLLARGGVEEEKVREFGSRIGIEAERLSRLVSSILDLARLEGGGATGAPRERVDLRELAAEVVERFEPLARDAGFSVKLRAAEEALTVRVEREALAGALLNLLDNAKKYADEPHEIELVLESSELGARLRVLDRGRGLPESERERIFEAFARVGDEDTRDRPGAGLGLAIVKRVIAAHGGAVGCAARSGGGSEFWIDLPLSGDTE